jgi:hypothetical protein
MSPRRVETASRPSGIISNPPTSRTISSGISIGTIL